MKDKAIFCGEMTKLMNTDSHWTGGNRSFTDAEMKEFIEHLWVYMMSNGPAEKVNADRLAKALVDTQRKFANEQDRAKAMVKML